MKKKKSTKTYAEVDDTLFKLLKAHAGDTYFLEVLYYYICRALIVYEYNLSGLDGIIINGRFLGNKMEVLFSPIFDTILKSLSFAMSIRTIILNKDNINKCYNDRLLFYDIEKGYLSWDSHQIIMECINDEKFRLLYEMIVSYKNNSLLTNDQKEKFNAINIRPEYKNLEKYLKSIASDPSYEGKSVIKNNEYLYAEFKEFEVPKEVEYIGDTAFAYCRNLRTLMFTKKVLFGHFPIIECNELKYIVVPTDLVDYYKQELPYYNDIIADEIIATDKLETIESHIDDAPQNTTTDENGIEHIYIGIPSVAPYTEIELEEKPNQEEEQSLEKSIDIKKLNSIFDKKATSYKYFWFLSVISLAKEEESLKVAYKDILIRMAALAWPIIFDYEIVFGKSDMLPKYLVDITKKTTLIKTASSNIVENYLRQHFTSQGIDKILEPLLKNVPYRFLSPWIPFTTNEEVKQKSNSMDYACPYALGNKGVLFDEDWWEYIMENYTDIVNFTKDSFIAYVKQNNDGLKLLKLNTVGFNLINNK